MADSYTHAINIEAVLNLTKSKSFEKDITAIAKRIASTVYDTTVLENNVKKTVSSLKRTLDDQGNVIATDNADKGGKKKETAEKKMESISKGTQAIAQAGVGILKSTVGIVSQVLERLKASSPLLQAVESLFNLAMQLFFMPLGTKLATVLIPSIVELVDDVMQIWDGFEDKSLGDLLKETIELGAKIFGEYFQNIGAQLATEGGILGTIGNLLTLLGEFIENNGENMIKNVIWIVEHIMKYLPQILGAIIAFKTMSYLMQAALILTTSSITPWSAAIGAAAIAGVGALAGTIATNMLTAADGGYFPATPGGVPVLIAEGGEGETVVPDGKKVDFAKSVLGGGAGNTYNIYVNGYTDTDLEDKIVRVLNEQTNLSRLRSGF